MYCQSCGMQVLHLCDHGGHRIFPGENFVQVNQWDRDKTFSVQGAREAAGIAIACGC